MRTRLLALTVAFGLSLLFNCLPLHAQDHEIPAAVRSSMQAFIEALNSNDAKKIEDFVRSSHHPRVLEQVPMNAFVARWQTVHAQAGPVTAKQFKPVSPTSAAVWTRGTITQLWVGFQFFYEKDAPHRVMTIARDSGPTPPAEFRLRPARTPRDLASRMGQYLDEMEKGGFFSGSVLIARNGKPVLRRGLGSANSRTSTANRGDTVFNIASLSKMFTGVAIGVLSDKGRISYSDPVSKFIPEYPKHIADQVTIRDLLTHTSGIELDDIPGFKQRLANAPSVKDYVEAQIEFLPKMEGFDNFKKPTEYNYTNEGYALLARIIEVASGEDYFAFLSKYICLPAGMKSTFSIYKEGPLPRNLAMGYTSQDPNTGAILPGPMREVTTFNTSIPSPSGGVDSSVDDLLRFANLFFGGKIVSLDTVRVLTTRQVDEAEGRYYGYGFMLAESLAGDRVGHSGANMGFSSRLDHYPRSGYTVIVLANRDRIASTLADLVMELLAETPAVT